MHVTFSYIEIALDSFFSFFFLYPTSILQFTYLTLYNSLHHMLTNNPGRIGRLSSGVPCTFEKGSRPASAITTIKQRKPSTPVTKNRRQGSCQPSSISTAVSAKNDSSFDSTGLTVGQKVSVSSLCALGTIRYIGAIGIKPGLWIGLELDITGSGKNDGSIKG
jgi:hypothetical protein